MKITTQWALGILMAVSLVGLVFAQDYPKFKPSPRPKATTTPSASTPTPDAATPAPAATPDKPKGPLKMITTDGKNKDSPIKVLEMNYYDSGYGKYNSEVRVSCKIQNAGSNPLKKVTLKLQIVNGDKQVVQEWKKPIGEMKPNAVETYNPGVWYNTLGVLLQGRVTVEHEEVDKDAGKDKAKGGK